MIRQNTWSYISLSQVYVNHGNQYLYPS